MLTALMLSAIGMSSGTTTWTLDGCSDGDDVIWNSPDTVDPDADTYVNLFEVVTVEVTVSWFGQEFGPIDVTYMLDELTFPGEAPGPCPTEFDPTVFVFPEPPDPVAVAFELHTVMNAEGMMTVNITNIQLGQTEVEIPIFGEVTVLIEELCVNGLEYITPTYVQCPADINADGIVGVNDILVLIGDWGTTGSPADLDGSGAVDANDLLMILAAWGPC